MTPNDCSRPADARNPADTTVVAAASPAPLTSPASSASHAAPPVSLHSSDNGEIPCAEASYEHGSLEGCYLGAYWLKELLAVGGMAEVYRARDLVRQRVVAVKVLASHLAEDANCVAQFRNEARRAEWMRHPHIVPVYDMGEEIVGERRVLYLVMPLLKQSLSQRLHREHSLPYPEAVSVTLEVAAGLQAAHEAGLIHCDVKPGNILLDTAGHALLCDFGVALDSTPGATGSAPGATPAEEPSPAGQRTDSPEIREWIAGTPAYMAPEQLCGGVVDQRADVYSLGVVLYLALTGKLPFGGKTPLQIATRALRDPVIPPSALVPDRALPLGMDRVLLAALARDPRDRFSTMDEFATALRHVRADPADSWDTAFSRDEWEQWPATATLLPAIPQGAGAPRAARFQQARGAKRLLAVAALAASLACAAGVSTILQSLGAPGMTNGGRLSLGIPATEARAAANTPRVVVATTPTPTPTPNAGGGGNAGGEAALVSPAAPQKPQSHDHGQGHGHGHNHKHSPQNGGLPMKAHNQPNPAHPAKPESGPHGKASPHGKGQGHDGNQQH